ncbi:DUF805 domain-containing protein [Virgibacillus litoralis]|uniref:Uncharacterized membrane protein YhaH (DUF805 family) n=1 Tax=Virgibacillus litoralis TaxID=578221 RepID=A0ABS4H8E2_9BACI|nr:DUF805 domain-containing protein [Virgibacillus litoralis]MBP1947181.1 uncharacterized membrane protein YhaH (DUF805 family) [Virgibacillus litoralis]
MNWYIKVLKNYVEFEGRARRQEYWMFGLVSFIIAIILGIFEGVLGISGVLSGLYSLFIFLPGLAVAVRRLHDTGKSGFWVLISLIPVAGAIVLLIFMCLDSDLYENKYGPNPKFN